MKYIAILAVILLAAGAWWYWDLSETDREVEPGQMTGREATETDEAFEVTEVMHPGVYEADLEQSSVGWEAGKPAIAGYVHHGSFRLQSGQIALTDSALTGSFVIDMNSVKIDSLGGGKAGQESALEGHLKGSGFFDTANHPTATFTITDVTPKVFPGPDQTDYTATGELSIKGQRQVVTFPIKVTVLSSEEVAMKATLSIDRTSWGISFGSAKIAQAITDNIIGDTVKLDIALRLQR